MAKNDATQVWNPEEVQITKQLNNSFRMVEGKVYVLQALSALYVDPTRGQKQKGKVKMEAPTLMRVLDLSDGREFDIILATIPQTRIEEAFPDGKHVGEVFRIVQHGVRDGERYRDYDVDVADGSKSPHYRKPAECIANAKNYGPREPRKEKAGKAGK